MKKPLILLVALTIAGCGGGGKSGSSGGTVNPADIAAKAGCTGYSSSSGELYVKEGGDCDLNGQTINVKTFQDTAARDNWLKIAQSFGGVFGEGDRWVISGEDAATVRSATKAAGGKEVP